MILEYPSSGGAIWSVVKHERVHIDGVLTKERVLEGYFFTSDGESIEIERKRGAHPGVTALMVSIEIIVNSQEAQETQEGEVLTFAAQTQVSNLSKRPAFCILEWDLPPHV